MKAIIMAGGKGARLAPYTAVFPKPLMPIGDKPILELLLMQLNRHGVTEVVLAVNHLSHLIESFFGNGSRFGLSITYTHEHSPLGTAGPLGNVLEEMGEHFFLLNGDLLTTLDYSRMYQFHLENDAAATIAAHERTLKSDFGVLDISQDCRLEGYREKPEYKHLVSMGCYVLSQKALRGRVIPDVRLDMPELMQLLLDDGKHVSCFIDSCFWLDIGRPSDYAQAQEIYERDSTFFLVPRHCISNA